ncbi:phenylalanine--tRNA ligase subunit beta [Paraconexibacter sp.]|uniref:phenylalanine--tRNA ligase subunit beta n=1 Tax=Paraconexibacter sp. TaxID=2949640 RepID=UPI00356795D4
MRLPLSWLHDHVVPDLPVRELATRLAMTGTEVDRIHHHGVSGLEHFVVGRVLTCERHPDADRLSVCTVDVGDAEPSQIVCGAPNVAAGQTVAVGKPGSIMPDGTKLKTAKLRGVASAGMILAEDEVGIGQDHAGIMVLDDGDHLGAALGGDAGASDAPPAVGTPLRDVLPISDEVLELEITPNRPDCLGVYGVAREAAAATGAPLGPAPWDAPECAPAYDELRTQEAGDPGQAGDIRIHNQAPDLCPRMTWRLYENVTLAPSPRWLKARLMAAGQRPINNVVDITNYVMLLTGQPLHAFDADRIEGGTLILRRAREGEQVTTLDEVQRTLDGQMLVFEDGAGPTSIAGVMGGRRSEIFAGEDGAAPTSRVLMEVATWDGPNINRTMARLGLRSEAGARFEKGLAPEQTLQAQAVAHRLMVELCGATPVGGTLDLGGDGPPPARIRLRDASVAGLLGAAVPRERSAEVLRVLGFGVEETDDGLEVTVPAFRRLDVTREADLIEEVARLEALDTLPATIPENRTGHAAVLDHAQRTRRRAEDALVGAGLHEVCGWSFTEPAVLDRLRIPEGHALREVVRLENPMSEAQSILRPTILGSLLDAAAYNRAHGQSDIAIFESGSVYAGRRGADGAWAGQRLAPADEHHALGVLLHGAIAPASWRDGTAPAADVFAAKGVLETVLGALRVPFTTAPAPDGAWPFLHPGRSAAVLAGDQRIGFLGEVHPLVAQAWDLDGLVAAFAIDLGKVTALAPEVATYRDLMTFPALRQDLAIVVPDDVPSARVLEVVRDAAGKRLADARVFDVYRGEQLGAGRVSLAVHCEFRAPDRTLTDEDIEPLRSKIIAALAEQVGGELRG